MKQLDKIRREIVMSHKEYVLGMLIKNRMTNWEDVYRYLSPFTKNDNNTKN